MKSRRTGTVIVLTALSATFLLSACSTTTKDFRDEAEKFLESKDLAKEAGYTYTDAVCESPTSTTIGSQFACRAVDNDGDEWTFIAEITGEREIVFVSGEVTG
jgi:hypothetical protein